LPYNPTVFAYWPQIYSVRFQAKNYFPFLQASSTTALKKDRRSEKMGFEHEHITGFLPVDYDCYAVESEGD